jgi:hypothetical protein
LQKKGGGQSNTSRRLKEISCNPFDFKKTRTRGDCPSFEPLLAAFLEINLNNNPELQLVQELMKKYA